MISGFSDTFGSVSTVMVCLILEDRTDVNGGDNATVSLTASEANGVAPAITPNIDYNFQIVFVPGQDPVISGSHDGFPAYTITVVDKDGNTVGTYQFTPETEFEAFYLFGSDDVFVPERPKDGPE